MGDGTANSADEPLREMEQALVVSKLEAAGRQLATAADLFMHDADPVSIHTLTAAAYDIIRDVDKARDGDGMMWKDWVFMFVPPEKHKEVRRKVNEAQNFLKHADSDPTGILEFRPFLTALMIFDASLKYHELTGKVPLPVKVFHYWFFTSHPELVQWPSPEMAAWAQRVAVDGRAFSRTEFCEFGSQIITPLPHIIDDATHSALQCWFEAVAEKIKAQQRAATDAQ
jgi:hypothetical protein